jgi:membrane associated rhomboid family serine protease
VLLVGASGGISGLMGASVRLIYAEGMPLAVGIRRDVRRVRPLTFTQALTLPGPRVFVLTWIGLNLVISLIGFGGGEGMDRIAGDAHIAGFFAGLALFPLFDRPLPRHDH